MNDQLTTFIAVADNHSFSQAANQLFLSVPAVMKQINALEDRIKVQLFQRTHSGVSLTPAGKSFYADATKLVAAYQASILHAQDLSAQTQTLKIGAGPLAAGNSVSNLWLELAQAKPQLSLQFIPCSCSLGSFNEFLAGINHEFDLVASIYDKNLLTQYNLAATQLYLTPLRISVPIQNPLSSKPELSLQDLADQTVALPAQGKFSCFDKARAWLSQQANIQLHEIAGFDLAALNNCVKHNWLLCSAEDWQTAHPLLKSKTVAWNCTAPFGLIYGHPAVVDEVLAYIKK
ncbi:MAG: LysR family transcriptional regulator [Lactobacillus sp.]|jgi:DNA-binding transcriptional LysR family regulator|nr:LysR family transcriptional regulator [Lactobacillus sp.]MCH4069208.1 LysR family transcriptional regulator [Lactobacillus sp.]MCI1303510.1 LysR family transcriptional regulator [Lactobacillus sp.]MCI1329686.1 LysR family transcriptional regulator [Lactobacillus sp.]MCI1359380.1 LysR family transcriptional regulator [Lactobacillus sp.]